MPNWSKLASLGRMLFVLAGATFFAALVLPLAADGTLPLTWAAWRPVLLTAGSAAALAEFVWIRSHLAAFAASLGLTGAPSVAIGITGSGPAKAAADAAIKAVDATPPSKTAEVVAKIAPLACIAFCIAPTVLGCGLFGAVEPPAADCATRILADAAAGMSVTQIVEDAGGPCAVDAAAVMAALLASSDPKVKTTKAYGESLRAKTSLDAIPVR